MVIVYTKPSCVQCKRTKDLMNSHGIEYETVDISENPEARQNLIAQGYSQMPIVHTTNDEWSGFRPDKIKELAND